MRRVLTKERVAAWLEGRFFLRLHMFLLLGGTYLAGLLATKLLLSVGVNRLWLRYALAVCAAYLVFLALIRLWLYYVRADRRGIDVDADGVELLEVFWPDHDVPADGATVAVPAPKVSSGGGYGGGLDVDLDDGCLIVLILALVFSLVAVGVYLIYTAPVLLTEAAFEAALAAALARRAKKIERPGWVGTVWRATIWPFIGVLLLSAALGWAVQNQCPEAKKLRDVWECRLISSAAS